jgi:hypothetical protein
MRNEQTVWMRRGRSKEKLGWPMVLVTMRAKQGRSRHIPAPTVRALMRKNS